MTPYSSAGVEAPFRDRSSSDRPSLFPTPGMDGSAKKLTSACGSFANMSVSRAVSASIDSFFDVLFDQSSSPTTPRAIFSPPALSMLYPATEMKYFTPSIFMIRSPARARSAFVWSIVAVLGSWKFDRISP